VLCHFVIHFSLFKTFDIVYEQSNLTFFFHKTICNKGFYNNSNEFACTYTVSCLMIVSSEQTYDVIPTID
jgi:hypothetical protein